jgi:hypothetical protein
MAWPILGAESVTSDAPPAASAVLQRFIASQGQVGAWPLDRFVLEASSPNLQKTGRLPGNPPVISGPAAGL